MNWLVVVQVVLGVILIALVMMQSQGGGLGTAFGGLATYHTKRGIEKSLFISTIVVTVCFTLTSLFILVV